jgi:hypothetical protein
MEHYIEEHNQWRAIATDVLPFEAISSGGTTEIELLKKLGKYILSKEDQVDYEGIAAQIAALPIPGHHMDLVSKLWPLHMSKRGPLNREPIAKLSEADVVALKQRLAPLLRG